MSSIPQPKHNSDLERRYREIDFVSELQKYWAYFDKWLKEETHETEDRAAVDKLKNISKVQDIIQNLLDEGRGQIRDNDLLSRDYQTYLSDNDATNFVKYSWVCPVIRDSLNLFNPNIIDRVRGTGTIHLTHEEYLKMYHLVRAQEGSQEGIGYHSLIDDLYSYAGITRVGSCFFRDSVTRTANTNLYYESCWQKIVDNKDPDLGIIRDLRASPYNPGIYSDIIEMLYQVRCKAVHGDLDFVNKSHNDVSKSAVFLL